MPRSATDATRFTSTTPHASAKPTPINPIHSKLPPKSPGPPNETPQQRVKRLRAAADRARDAQISTFDKLILRGRVWADKAHRFTALSLIGITFIAGGVTVYALGDMMIYNRRKRAEFFAEQKFKYQMALENARQAEASGRASETQLEFLKKEREHEEKLKQWEEDKKKKGMWARSKAWLFEGMKQEEDRVDVGTNERKLEYEASSGENDTLETKKGDVLRAIEEKKVGLQDKAKKAFDVEKERQVSGGPLDRIGTDAEKAEGTSRSGGWTSWMVRR